MSCKHGNYEGINGRDCDLCEAEDEIWKICAAKDVEIADLKAAYESLFKENAARRAAALASPAPSVGEPVAQWQTSASGEGGWMNIDADEVEFCRDKRGYKVRALVLATPPAAPAATEAPSKPFAYYIHIAAEQRGEFVHDLDEALDDLTNCECKITELFAHAAPTDECPYCHACWPECLHCDGTGLAAPAAAVPESPAWIDVKDRVPTHLYSVLGVVTDGPFVVQGDPEDRMRDVVGYSPERGCWLQHDGNDSVVVTVSHWQVMADLP